MNRWVKWAAPSLCVALATAVVTGAARAEEAAAGTAAEGASKATAAPPFDLSDPARVAAGKKRFNANCAAYCHGAEGSGGRTPAFKGNTFFAVDMAFKTITEGRRTTDVMPPWGKAFTPEQIWELVSYLNHLSKLPADD